ncbi:substrate-binding domain-containing protein [Cupriavidus basilensis]|uniref:substrate-binding domain-containing protein n=1 Tax=Cupriavidus basilensis TaxID=68895 RepID=UPI00283BC43A|nr:substrate-binding domain-containing protein [Cupriavidus basilensis]MDR3384389.1 substrate-binding domain-containing protein [Cupriavidus basilensis]
MRDAKLALRAMMLAGALAALPAGAQAPPPDKLLRVCADPNSLPSSNQRGEGYENRIAQAMAKDMGKEVAYTFFPQRMGFVRNTLRAKDPDTGAWKCDLIVGVPKDYELTANTQPYMHSTYALVFRQRDALRGVATPEDLLKLPPEILGKLRFGIFSRAPSVDWLLRNKLFEQAVVYQQQSGDPDEVPGGVVERDLLADKIDIAILWGPIAGYLARQHAGAGEWVMVPFRPDPQLKFDYEIAMGVRFGEKAWKDEVDRWIAGNQEKINAILASYRIPLVDDKGNPVAGLSPNLR